MEKRQESVTAKITPAEKAALEKIAREDERTLSFIVSKAIKDFIKSKQI